MARPVHVEFPAALYQVMARSNERKPVFRDNQDRRRFMESWAVPPKTLEEGEPAKKIKRMSNAISSFKSWSPIGANSPPVVVPSLF